MKDWLAIIGTIAFVLLILFVVAWPLWVALAALKVLFS